MKRASLQRKTPLKAVSERRKRCPICRIMYHPARKDQRVCGEVKCALSYISAEEGKAAVKKAMDSSERESHKAAKERLKRRGDHMRDAQVAFNAFIRLRDQLAGHPCISSGKPLDWSGNQTDAGHYRSVGSAPHLRFDERNCHAQSKVDNRFLSGNAVDYRIGLIARIGLEAVESLESDQSVKKYTIDDLKAITAEYRARVREMQKRA